MNYFLLLFLIYFPLISPLTTETPQKLGYFERASLLIKTNCKNFSATGTIAPTSSTTIQEILKPLKERNKDKPVRILEVGFGEGCITREIIKDLGKHDIYYGVELDENLFKSVSEECKGKKRHFLCGPVETCKFPENNQFDFIISTVPLSTIPTEPVKKILTKEHELLKKTGTLSYIAYWLSFTVMGALSFFDSEKSQSHDDKMSFIKEWRTKFTWTEHNVPLNLPPVSVFHGIKTH